MSYPPSPGAMGVTDCTPGKSQEWNMTFQQLSRQREPFHFQVCVGEKCMNNEFPTIYFPCIIENITNTHMLFSTTAL